MDEGEAPAHAAVRESLEEGGVTVQVEALLGAQDLRDSSWLALAFLARHIAGEPKPDGRETDRARYLSSSEMDLLGEPFEPWCEWLVRRVLAGDHYAVPLRPGDPILPGRAFL